MHRQQVINYLLLSGLNYGKLINFRPTSVDSKFVSTNIDFLVRKDYFINSDEWFEDSAVIESVRKNFEEMLVLWGVFLDFKLYNEALVHFLGGKEQIIKPVAIWLDDQIVGYQNMQVIDNGTILHISGINKAIKGYENSIRKLFNHTELNRVCWINFNKQEIVLKIIK